MTSDFAFNGRSLTFWQRKGGCWNAPSEKSQAESLSSTDSLRQYLHIHTHITLLLRLYMKFSKINRISTDTAKTNSPPPNPFNGLLPTPSQTFARPFLLVIDTTLTTTAFYRPSIYKLTPRSLEIATLHTPPQSFPLQTILSRLPLHPKVTHLQIHYHQPYMTLSQSPTRKRHCFSRYEKLFIS